MLKTMKNLQKNAKDIIVKLLYLRNIEGFVKNLAFL